MTHRARRPNIISNYLLISIFGIKITMDLQLIVIRVHIQLKWIVLPMGKITINYFKIYNNKVHNKMQYIKAEEILRLCL